MYKLSLTKPDGRLLHLYSRHPLDPNLQAPGPERPSQRPQPHLRWHPLRGEWVAYAAYRQNRVFLPPKEYNPLAPPVSPQSPTEVPAGNWDAAVFDNLSPAFTFGSELAPKCIVPTRPATGTCEVVVFCQDADMSLGRLPLWHIELILKVWTNRYLELGARKEIHYVMPFENRGVEVGVTLHHPHGQLYAYPFIPPVAKRELAEQKAYFASHRRGLLETHIEGEIKEGSRILYEGERAVAFVPAFARYPYEVWVAPIAPLPSLKHLSAPDYADLARALKTVLLKFDGLWNRPFPYLMVLHQAPTLLDDYPEAHLHFEFYPPYRSRERLKYLAGTELGAGVFANDCLPEEKAQELRDVKVRLE